MCVTHYLIPIMVVDIEDIVSVRLRVVLVVCLMFAKFFDAFMECHRFTWFEVHGVLLRQASKFGSSLARVGSAWLVQSMQHGCYSKFLNESC